MQAVVFIPGIMGTELIGVGSELVWPPTPSETIFGYGRVDKLLAPTTKAGNIIQSVASCFNVYGSILREIQALGYTVNTGTKRLYPFPYDWRIDLQTTAAALAAMLDRVHADGATDITLVAHSMGGLVARLVLEPATYRARPWFAQVSLFVALATPHRGAPLALARVMGLDASLGVSGPDFRRIAADHRYPSGYQLLPAPGESACWNQSDSRLAPVDIYTPAGIQSLGLDSALIARAKWVHDTLGAGQTPPKCRYFYFAGTGHQTVTRLNVYTSAAGKVDPARLILTRTPDAGDGTVPFWSALPRTGQKEVVVNEHASVFTGKPFLAVFRRLLGGPDLPALEGLAGPEIILSLDAPIQHVGIPIELVLSPDMPLNGLRADIVAEPIDDAGHPIALPRIVAALTFSGAEMTFLRINLPGFTDPGHYRLRLVGDDITSPELVFSVAPR